MKQDFREKFHDNILYYGLILCVITLPFSFQANSISIIILCLNWLAEGKFSEKMRMIKGNLIFQVFVGFYFLHLIGLAYTSNISQGAFEIQKKLSLLVFPLVLATSKKLDLARILTICKAFLATTIGATLICLGNAVYRTNFFQTFPNINWLWFSYRDLTMILNIQATYLALYVCFSVLFLLYLLWANKSEYGLMKKIVLGLAIFYLVIFLFLLASRIAIAALLFISFSGILFSAYKSGKLMKGLAAIGGISLLLVVIIFQMPLMKERFLLTFGIEQNAVWISQYGDGTTRPAEARTQTWTSAWNVLKDNFIIGTGTGDVQDQLQEQHEKSGFREGYESHYNAHNQYLETWIGLGIPGLLLLLAAIFLPAVKAFKTRNYLHLAFIALIAISLITECMLCRQHGVVFYALFASLFTFHMDRQTV